MREGKRPPYHAFLVVSYEFCARLLFSLPRYRVLNGLKALFLRLCGAQVGKRVVFYPGVWITPARGLVIGNDVDLALEVILTTSGGVTIGDRTLVGYRAQILSGNHRIPEDRERIFDAGHEFAPVRIGMDVWIGANAVLLPGTSIGDGAVIAAGSVVTKSVDPFTVVAGNPARIVRVRS